MGSAKLIWGIDGPHRNPTLDGYARAAPGRHTRAQREVLVNRFERFAQAEGVTMVGEACSLTRWLRRRRS